MEIKYDIPIEVTWEKLKHIRKRFGMLIAWRKDNEGRYWVKLWHMGFKNELEKELNNHAK